METLWSSKMDICSVSLDSVFWRAKDADIDFGHILGNFKSKAGIKRERAAFVFTPEMAFIIAEKCKKFKGHPNFEKFVELCVQAYQTIREEARLWVILFRLVTLSDWSP